MKQEATIGKTCEVVDELLSKPTKTTKHLLVSIETCLGKSAATGTATTSTTPFAANTADLEGSTPGTSGGSSPDVVGGNKQRGFAGHNTALGQSSEPPFGSLRDKVGQQQPALLELASGLRSVGAAVWSLVPQQYCCNNIPCTTLGCVSEADLVSGPACVCSGCGIARYCSRACQEMHWALHKPLCGAISRFSADGK